MIVPKPLVPELVPVSDSPAGSAAVLPDARSPDERPALWAHITPNARLVGRRLGLDIRNSTPRQRDNVRARYQLGLKEWLEAQGASVVVYDERGTSGQRLSKRKVAQRMLADLAAGTLGGIAAADLSRLSRDKLMIDRDTIEEVCIRRGAIIVTRRGGIFDLSRYEHRKRWRKQMRRAAEYADRYRHRCYVNMSKRADELPYYKGWIPFGYEPYYIPNPRKRQGAKGNTHLRLLRADRVLQAEMDALAEVLDEAVSYRHAVRLLNERKVGAGRVGTWTDGRVRYIVHNPLYYGVWRHNRHVIGTEKASSIWKEHKGDQVHFRPECVWWPMDRLLTWQQKFAANRRRRTDEQGNKVDSPQRRSRADKDGNRKVHPFLGLLHCTACGDYMVAHSSGYACRNYNDAKCEAPQFVAERLVAGAFRDLLTRLVDQLDLAAKGGLLAEMQQGRAEIEGRLEVLRLQRTQLLERLEREEVDEAEGLARLKHLRAQVKALEAKLPRGVGVPDVRHRSGGVPHASVIVCPGDGGADRHHRIRGHEREIVDGSGLLQRPVPRRRGHGRLGHE